MRRIAPVLVSLWWTGLLLGLPTALIRLVGWPLPDHRPTRPELEAWVQQPLTRATIVGTAAVLIWAMWACLLAVVLTTVYRRVVGVCRHLPDLRLPAPLQGLSAAMLGTVAVSSSVGAAATPAAALVAVAGADAYHPARPDVTGDGDKPTQAGSPAPPTDATRPAEADEARRQTVTVRRGDTLWELAQTRLGDPRRWPEIYRLNADRYDQHGRMRHGDHIEPGWVFNLPNDVLPEDTPGDARPPGPNPPAAIPNPAPPPVDPAPSAPAPAPPSQPATRQPSPGSSAAASALVSPSTSAAASPAPSSVASAVPSPPRSASPARSPIGSGTAPAGIDRPTPSAIRNVGVRLPGGWVPIPFAAALIAAAAMVWLRRRHRYVPGKLAGPILKDPDPRPLPPAVTVLRRGVRRHAPDLLAPTERPEAAPDRNAADADRPPAGDLTAAGRVAGDRVAGDRVASQGLPPIGPSGPDLAGLARALPMGGLGLVGDGALAAARAMLVATLSSGSPEDPDARGQVVVPVDALTTLLGVDAVNLDPTPRLTVTATLGEALTRLEELLIERRRTLQDEDADGLSSMRAADPMHPPMPPVLLLSEVPGPDARPRLTTTLHLGAPLQINAVLVGDWPRGDTLDLDTEGYTDTNGSDHLGVLDTPTTLQLLQLLSEAHTGRLSTAPVPEPTRPSIMDDDDPTRDVLPELELPELELPALDPQTAAHAGSTGTPSDVHRHDAADTASPPPDTGHTRVPIHVLGRPTLITTSPPRQELRRRALELLVYLAMHRGGANLPDIKEAFWPDASNRRAGERLQTEVGDLRARVRDAYHTANGDLDEQIQPVVNTGGRYHLNPDLLDVDWWTVQDALAAATTDTAHRIDHLRRAVDAFHGPLAEGCTYDWLPDVEEHVRRQGIIAYTQLATLVADTDPAETANLLDRATDLDPINEELARAAMRAHTRVADADAVRAQLHRIRTALDEIDVELDEATTTLATDLLRQITAQGAKTPRRPGEPPQP